MRHRKWERRPCPGHLVELPELVGRLVGKYGDTPEAVAQEIDKRLRTRRWPHPERLRYGVPVWRRVTMDHHLALEGLVRVFEAAEAAKEQGGDVGRGLDQDADGVGAGSRGVAHC